MELLLHFFDISHLVYYELDIIRKSGLCLQRKKDRHENEASLISAFCGTFTRISDIPNLVLSIYERILSVVGFCL